MKFKKYAIVTGGTTGIGLGVVQMLASKGYYVFTTYNKTELKERIDNVESIKVDHGNREEVYGFIKLIKSRIDHIDCLVCNAGTSIRKTFTDYRDEDWDVMMEVILNSHYIMCRELFRLIPPGSRLIFTGSEMGVMPHGTVLAYGVAKSAIHALCKNLVKEFDGTNTTVNVVVPGFVETSWQKCKPEYIKENIYKKTAIHRFATIDEIVSAFEFCVDNAFVNGSLIEVNGGYCYK